MGKSRLVKVIYTNIHKISDACANIFGGYIIIARRVRNLWWPSAATVNFQIEINITFQKRNINVFQNFKTPFILIQFSNKTIKSTKTAKQFLFYFHSFNFGF